MPIRCMKHINATKTHKILIKQNANAYKRKRKYGHIKQNKKMQIELNLI